MTSCSIKIVSFFNKKNYFNHVLVGRRWDVYHRDLENVLEVLIVNPVPQQTP